MHSAALGPRFLESTRGRIVSQLRRGDRTVDELARALALTDNAVRSHLAALERDGLVRQVGSRRGAGAGKPAVLYELRADAAPLLSRAYSPLLSVVLDVLVEELAPERSEAVLREVGRRLARTVGGRAHGDLDARVRAAAGVLEALGGEVDVRTGKAAPRLEGAGCPLSAVVCHRPEVCRAVESLLTEVVGEPVHSCCTHGAKPRCCFSVGDAA
jgi:predicted ArsR family transcriptional regulator